MSLQFFHSGVRLLNDMGGRFDNRTRTVVRIDRRNKRAIDCNVMRAEGWVNREKRKKKRLNVEKMI